MQLESFWLNVSAKSCGIMTNLEIKQLGTD